MCVFHDGIFRVLLVLLFSFEVLEDIFACLMSFNGKLLLFSYIYIFHLSFSEMISTTTCFLFFLLSSLAASRYKQKCCCRKRMRMSKIECNVAWKMSRLVVSLAISLVESRSHRKINYSKCYKRTTAQRLH